MLHLMVTDIPNFEFETFQIKICGRKIKNLSEAWKRNVLKLFSEFEHASEGIESNKSIIKIRIRHQRELGISFCNIPNLIGLFLLLTAET